MKRTLAALFLTCAAPLSAHPHVFVETTIEFHQDDKGHVVEVEVTWTYDDFFSLLILEDLELDTDGDGQLTDEEFQKLWAFDLENWDDFEGFEGDLYLNRANGTKVELGPPKATKIDMDDQGRIIAGHRRAVDPVSPKGMYVHQYDPTFYVAYSISGGVHFETGCTADVSEADLEAASKARNKALEESLAEETEDIFETVELGIYYADRIKVTCNELS